MHASTDENGEGHRSKEKSAYHTGKKQQDQNSTDVGQTHSTFSIYVFKMVTSWHRGNIHSFFKKICFGLEEKIPPQNDEDIHEIQQKNPNRIEGITIDKVCIYVYMR